MATNSSPLVVPALQQPDWPNDDHLRQAHGLFSYRVLPGGSIFIGASGKGSVAADAEFLVVRFKPIGAPGTAELKISSVSLQDTTGRAIAYQQPAPFRTIISQ